MNRDLTEIQNQIEESGVIELDHDDALGVSDKVRTNIPQLDEKLSGGWKSGLHGVTGGPASYKSATLLQIAYLAAMDGRAVTYITDEISSRECWQRLTARKMQVDNLVGDGTHDVPPWASLEEAARVAARDDDAETLERIGNAIRDVKNAKWRSPDYGKLSSAGFCNNGRVWLSYDHHTEGRLTIKDMGELNAPERDYDNDEGYDLFVHNSRYLVSALQDESLRDYIDDDIYSCDLLIIDAVNSLRLFRHYWDNKYENWYFRDHMPEPRARMETIVETLDNYAKTTNKVIVGVFHVNRTTGKYPQPPSMGDFKESSAIEHRTVSAMKFVRAVDMQWSNRPKPPEVPEGTEAVGLFLLKGRAGRGTEHNGPIWLCADGAHNLIYPLE